MGTTAEILARRGEILAVPSGQRLTINPQLRDQDSNPLDITGIPTVSGGFVVASVDGITFDVQNITTAAQDLEWTAEHIHSDQINDSLPIQNGVGPAPGAQPSLQPPLTIAGGGGGGNGNTLVSPITYTCLAGDAVGDCVCMNGSGAVQLADAGSLLLLPAIGFILSKPTPTSCIVAIFGAVPVTGVLPGLRYFVSDTPGQITSTPPLAPSSRQEIGVGINNDLLSAYPGEILEQ